MPIPAIFIDKAKNVRGYLLLSAVQGLSLKTADLQKLRQIHTGSAPVREPGLQLAYRFKDQDWAGKLEIIHEKASIVSEVCHIGSIGEGTLYGSSVFSFHISGAPLKKFLVSVNPQMKNLEFTGRDIVDWKKLTSEDGRQQYQVNLREKIFGDYTLLASYEAKLGTGEALCRFGDLTCDSADAENGFIILTSIRNLNIVATGLAEATHKIESAEIPQDFRKLLHNPVLEAYRFTRSPHWAEIKVSSYASQKMQDIAVDHAWLNTRIDGNGETVTQVEYRLKNASRQFLKMTLPEGAKLWTVKVDEETKRISKSNGHFLIPLPRHKDSNEPIAVFIEFAQEFGDLGADNKLSLQAPTLNLETMMCQWRVNIPNNYNFTRLKSNMTTKQVPKLIGLSGVYARLICWLKYWLKAPVLVGWLLLTLGGLSLAWSWGSRKLRIFLTIVGIVVLVFGIILTLGGLIAQSNGILPETSVDPINSGVFTKLFTQNDDVLSLELGVSNMRGFSFGRLFKCLLAGMLMLAVFVLAARTEDRVRKILLWSVAGTFATAALGQWMQLNALIAFLLSMILPLLLSVLLWIYVFRRSKNLRVVMIIGLLLLPVVMPAGDITIKQADYQVKIEITDKEEAVTVIGQYAIEAEDAGKIRIIDAPGILMGALPDDDDLEIIREGRNYVLDVKDDGEYEFQLEFLVPIHEARKGEFNFYLDLPPCRRNTVQVKVNKKNIAIESANAVSFIKKQENGLHEATASFVPDARAAFRLFPQVRDVEKEKAVFFANIHSLAQVASGFVEIQNIINIQMAQGELKKFVMAVPENMRVTSVSAPDLGAWRYDPDKQELEILLTQPHHGRFSMVVTTQIANCILPYSCKIGTLNVKKTDRQHGVIGLGVDPSVHVEVEESKGFNKINTDDITHGFRRRNLKIKKAFRYHDPASILVVKAEQVEPELRIRENCQLAFEEERTVLISDLDLEIAKSGIFSLSIDIPKEFDVVKVTGPEIRHWDEIADEQEHRILIHFNRRLLGRTQLRLELSMMEKEKVKRRVIPRIRIVDARKHKGGLKILLERGTRMEVIKRQGLEIRTGDFRKMIRKTTHRFSIVRPDWELEVEFDKALPWIQVESLQICKVAEGVLEVETHFHYTIENAGIKRFKIKLPDGAEVPEFIGKNIVGSKPLADGVWEIELHQKISHKYQLQIKYRQPYDKNQPLLVLPPKAVGVELQKGYLAVLTDDALQVNEKEKNGEIVEFSARKIPGSFRVKYLSNAVTCYRTVGSDFKLSLNIIRHKAAKLLPARIEKVDLISTVSQDGRLVTQVFIDLVNGNETFLGMKLPAQSSIWSVEIDQQPVEVAKESSGKILIPLKQNFAASRRQSIVFFYSQPQAKEWKKSRQQYPGPLFDTSLRNVTWTLYLPENYRYNDFAGTMDYVHGSFIPPTPMQVYEYDEKAVAADRDNRAKAKQWLNKANQLKSIGKQQLAFEAFQNAANMSVNDTELNSDIQGQWIASQREQSIATFANRRFAQKRGKMASPVVQQSYQQVDQGAVGNLKQELGGVEIRNMQEISDKIFMQQQAAATVSHMLKLTVPQAGQMVQFRRALQVKKDVPIKVSFDAEPMIAAQDHPWVIAAFMMMVIFTVMISLAGLAFRKRETTAAADKPGKTESGATTTEEV